MSEPIDYKALYAASYIDRSRLETENATLRAQAAAPDALLKKQRENLRALEQQVLAANAKVKGLDGRVNNLTASLTALAAENEELTAALRTLRQRHKAMREALDLCVASLDQLLPHLGKVPADIGLLNEALCAARPLLGGE